MQSLTSVFATAFHVLKKENTRYELQVCTCASEYEKDIVHGCMHMLVVHVLHVYYDTYSLHTEIEAC